MPPIIPCSIDGCSKPVKSRGWCSMHLGRNRRYGSPHTVLMEQRSPNLSIAEYKSWFESKLKPSTSPAHVDGDCLIWQMFVDDGGNGYGFASYKGRTKRAHIVAFFLANGRWPDGECCHRCDVPACCNPLHLYDGSHSDNMVDKSLRSRRSNSCKLQPYEVLEIVAALNGTEKLADIGARYGVSRQTVTLIKTGHRWSHLTGITPSARSSAPSETKANRPVRSTPKPTP